jgi:hypothetical protein
MKAKNRNQPLWWVSIPAPPNYSSPAEITRRAQEMAWDGGCPETGHHDCRWPAHVHTLRVMKHAMKTNGKAYRDFMAACARPIPPEDTP